MTLVNDVSTGRREQLIRVAEQYFRGLAQRDVSRVPWHPDVAFRGPLTPTSPDPLRGLEAVRTWFEGLYPALGKVEVLEHFIGERSIATRADVHITTPPAVLRVLDRFVVDDDGRIVEQENHFDPRPALQLPAGSMTAQERDLLIDLLVSSQHGLVAATVGGSLPINGHSILGQTDGQSRNAPSTWRYQRMRCWESSASRSWPRQPIRKRPPRPAVATASWSPRCATDRNG